MGIAGMPHAGGVDVEVPGLRVLENAGVMRGASGSAAVMIRPFSSKLATMRPASGGVTGRGVGASSRPRCVCHSLIP